MSNSNTYSAENINNELENLRSENPDDSMHESSYPYVIFTIQDNFFAISCKYVQSIEPTPDVTTEVSQSSPEIRGVSYYKNQQAINLIDMRKLLGIISQKEYLENIVNIPLRIREHENFVNNLEDCIINEKEINLTTDPHACNFGKWLDKYDPKSSVMKNHLKYLMEPHDALHKAVITIKDDISRNKKDKAEEVLNTVKNVYKKSVVEGLEELEKILYSEVKEQSIIIRVENKTVGLIVDYTESVEPINNIQRLPDLVIVSDYIQRYGIRDKTNSLILVLEGPAFA
jgi:chemotaxis signal transduction protein